MKDRRYTDGRGRVYTLKAVDSPAGRFLRADMTRYDLVKVWL